MNEWIDKASQCSTRNKNNKNRNQQKPKSTAPLKSTTVNITVPKLVAEKTLDKVESFSNTPNTHSDPFGSESDCEIIEDVTPIIVLDDDCTSESHQQTANESIDEVNETQQQTENETITSITEINRENPINSTETTLESSLIETNTDPEPTALFYVDTNPSTNCEAPIYEINPELKTNSNENMSSMNGRNIRVNGPVCFTNKENQALDETLFNPNPLLSSTLLYDSITGSSDDSSSKDQSNLHITINSTCETGTLRSVTASSSSPSTSAEKLANISNNNNIYERRPNKRKAPKDVTEEPPAKKNLSDVIVLCDTISDAEDEGSVVFVSETVQKRNRNLGSKKEKARDFISLRNDTANRTQNKVSTFLEHQFKANGN